MRYRRATIAALAATGLAAAGLAVVTASASATPEAKEHHAGRAEAPSVRILSPSPGDHTGNAGAAWIVDVAATYPDGTSGFTAAQLTGPAAHNNTAPFPGAFAPGQDEHLPGLVVLDSTTTGFSGPGTNLANLFNITALTGKDKHATTVQDTWIAGAPLFGTDVDTTVTVAVVGDLDHNGVFDDAPATVPDADHDGDVDGNDLRKLGTAGDVETVHFHINGTVTP